MALIFISGAWVGGILLGSKFNPPVALVLAGLIPLPLLFSFRKYRRTIILASLCLITLFGGALYFQASLPAIDEHNLQFYNDRGNVEIKGMVSDDPEVG